MKRDEVKEFNGENGKPAYIIYKNKVYDVTNSKLWKNGKHANRHSAGEELTDFISMAPHTEEVLQRYNIKFVAELEDDIEKVEDKKDKFRVLYTKLHPHPIFIHYPMGIFYFGYFMLLLHLITRNVYFEKASYYALVCAFLSIFPAVLSGILSWWLNYEATFTKIFKYKIVFSILLSLISFLTLIIRSSHPDLSSTSGIIFYIYFFLYTLIIPTLTFIAYNGGKITWPS
ncbi:cytochrome b5 [Deferribacter autotrophicus]|uniref:Cytochrome b5 n=1 Tax=Deferribacter autotrophicus TaxID=500465 RepID=A0A5A8F5P5_9BACT|nr:DUF2231 domain-containing protein [Deferribacter autotrophicus]KAA0258835.1 cytochrome b5 [Deferribacter autotrophicus]